MPTRRIVETTIIVVALTRPIFGTMRLWAVKTMQNTSPGTALHTVAEVVAVLT